jgi:hemoglobin/transferrin/lactoferrin receptor protein
VLAAVSRKKLGEYEIGRNGSVLNFRGEAQDAPVFTGLEAWSGLVKMEGRPTDDTTLDMSWLGYKSAFSAGTEAFSDTDAIVNQTMVGSFGWKPGTALVDLRTRLWYNKLQNEQHRPSRENYGAFDIGYALGTLGGSVDNTSRFDLRFADFKLNYGFEAFRDRTGATSTGADAGDDPENLWFAGPNPTGRRSVASGFGTATFDVGRWLSVSGGLRYDHYDLAGSARVFAGTEVLSRTVTICIPHPITKAPCWRTRQETVTTTHNRYASVNVNSAGGRLIPTATVSVTPFAGLQLFTKYSEGYRPPTIMETAFGGAHIGNIGYFGPNPGLKPEQSRTWEIGANVTRDDLLRPSDTFRLKAVWFDRKVLDYIGLGSVILTAIEHLGPQTYQSYVNLDGITRMRGVEVEGAYDAGPAYLGASFTYIDASFPFDGETATTSGPLLLYVPPKAKVTVDAGVRLLDRALTLGGRVTHVGKSEYEGLTAGQYELTDYTVLDLYGSYAFDQRTKLRFAVNNIADLAYVPALGGPTLPAPGRTATVSLNVKF